MELNIAQDWQQTITNHPYTILQPSPALHQNFLHLAKTFLDPLANEITNAQSERQRQQRLTRKRKRGQTQDVADKEGFLRMRKVHVDGFDIDQIWQQAKKVLDAAQTEIEHELPAGDDPVVEDGEQGDVQPRQRKRKAVRFDDEESESDDPDEEIVEDDSDSADDQLIDDEDMGVNGVEESEGDLEEEEDFTFEDDEREEGLETPPSEVSEEEEAREVLVKDRFGLNDGFFSIDEFNKQSQFLENQDARGDPDNGAASDEEEVDWGSNPLAAGASALAAPERRATRQRALQQKPEKDDEADEDEDQEDNEDEEDADGPTFGDMDLNAPEGASDEEFGEENEDDAMGGDFANTNQITYEQFFAPPAKKPSKRKQKREARVQKSSQSNGISKLANEDDSNGIDNDDAALERTMSAVHRDLFDDDLSDAHSPPPDPQTGLPSAKLSTHERAQSALRAEIRRLEAANVASKPWYLTGEAVSSSRPLNSLLEEDLDFETAGKPVPVVTEEVSEDIEALIKRRILAREFDEVVRRRADELLAGGGRRGMRRVEEVSGVKSKTGLAEEYEAAHLARTDPGFVDTRTAGLKAAHAEVEALWAKVSAQLDALSNWHYKPKPPAPGLEVRSNVAAVAMEDARPSAGGEVGGASMLAPQEVYRPGEEGKRDGEVVTSGGMVVAKEEESREQRRRRRAREKERGKKAAGNAAADQARAGKGVAGGEVKRKKATKEEVVDQLKKGGAKIIDKKGGLRDVEGNVVRDAAVVNGASGFKL